MDDVAWFEAGAGFEIQRLRLGSPVCHNLV